MNSIRPFKILNKLTFCEFHCRYLVNDSKKLLLLFMIWQSTIISYFSDPMCWICKWKCFSCSLQQLAAKWYHTHKNSAGTSLAVLLMSLKSKHNPNISEITLQSQYSQRVKNSNSLYKSIRHMYFKSYSCAQIKAITLLTVSTLQKRSIADAWDCSCLFDCTGNNAY